MKAWKYAWISVIQTCLRMLPFPCRTGLIEIGRPGRAAPVLLTCNFRLTVERVKRALEGVDAYLLVANSRGVNVWCAATGGLLSNHDVVSVLKTSGIAERVDHRKVILPQLAATGIEGPYVRRKTGWDVVWGPVEAASIPDFLRAGGQTTAAMRKVGFGWRRRLEMAVAWAFPISTIGALLVLPFWSGIAVPLIALVWSLSVLLFLSFPLYQRRLAGAEQGVGFSFFDFGPRGASLLLWLASVLAIVGISVVRGDFSWTLVWQWGGIALVVLAILGLDLTGSTPNFKSGLHEDRQLRIELNEQRCKGAAFCEAVCPLEVFEIDREARMAILARPRACVQCGACIVQCPFDALSFKQPDGAVIEPDTIRKFKLNLLGNRVLKTEGGRESGGARG
jgi:NAD-dependent dihydropyrimidine dehydrogenase PreA subunit